MKGRRGGEGGRGVRKGEVEGKEERGREGWGKED